SARSIGRELSILVAEDNEINAMLARAALTKAGRGTITTEIEPAGEYFYAEAYHQGYLAKNPAGYCGIGGTGVVCPIGVGVDA
ncbi:MAG: peptide-methionine (S)-S-oxide reductase, partial [Brevundimonas sp.]